MPETSPKSLTCPTCGAPLDYDGTSASVRCNFCKNVVVLRTPKPDTEHKAWLDTPVRPPLSEDILDLLRTGKKIEAIKRYREAYDVSLARAKYAIEQIEAGNLSNPEFGFEARHGKSAVKVAAATAAAGTASGAWLGGALSAFIILVVGGVIGFALLQPGGPFVPHLVAMQKSLLLPVTQNAPPDVVAAFYNVNEEARLVGRVSRAESKLVWQSDTLPGDGFVDDMLSDGERIYVAVEEDLLAFDTTDGRLAWETAMPDKLDSGEHNLVTIDGLVIAMTMDRSIQAYDAKTGKQVWSRPLLSYARGLRVMGEWLVILDYLSDGHDLHLFLIDPLDGSEEHILFPTCKSGGSWEETLDDDSGMVYDSATDALYLVFGLPAGCVQRYALSNGRLAWETQSEDSFDPPIYGFNYFQTPTTLYFGNSARLYALDKDTGGLKLLFEDDSYELTPLGFNSDILLTIARRTKGSERFELWGLEPASGERTWQMVPEDAGPIDPPYKMAGLVDNGKSGWTWRLTPAGLLLVRFEADPNQLVIATYNLADGSKLGEKMVPMKGVTGDFYSVPAVIGWHANEVYFILESTVYGLDVATGQLVLKYQ